MPILSLDDAAKVKIQIEVCSTEMDKLTDWEQGFIESVSDQFTSSGTLSPKQLETLKEIYDKVF